MVQVRGYTEDDVDVLADEFASVIQASLQRAVTAGANELSGAVVAASSAGLSPTNITAVSTQWQAEIDGVLVPYVGEVYTGSATSVAIGLAEGFPSEELAGIPLIADEFQLTYMKSVSNIFSGIGDDVWEDARAILVDGIKNGESIEQIAAKMMQVTDFTANHAEMVARTSVHSAAESGSIAQLRWMGYEDNEVEKEWLCTHDARTRPTHFHADKQKVPLSGKFTVGGSSLDFPGDPLGAFDEIVRCRCTALFNIDTAPKFRCDGLTAAAQSDATHCVMPVPAVDTSNITQAVRDAIFKAFMSHKISPAWGGAKIHKVLDAVRDASYAGEHGFTQPLQDVSNLQILKIVDEMKTGPSKSTFSEKYWEWLNSPAGKKAVGHQAPSVTHVVAPIKPEIPGVVQDTTIPSVDLPTPGVWSAPSQTKFTVLSDPGVSGDGYAAGGQWGKFGAAGVLVRAKDEQGVWRYLMIQRNGEFDAYEGGKWQLAGGALDELEGPYEGAAREVMEELGVDQSIVESMKPVGEMTYTGPGGWHYTTIAAEVDKPFAVDVGGPRFDVVSGKWIPPELSDAKWLTEEEIQQLLDEGQIVKHLDTQITPQISSFGTPFKGKPDYIASFDAPPEIGSLSVLSDDVKDAILSVYKLELKPLGPNATGSQIYGRIQLMIEYLDDPASGMTEAKNVSALQILRIMDTYQDDTNLEYTLLKWLQTTDAKKTVYKKGFPKSLLVKKMELPPKPPPLPKPPIPEIDPLQALAQAVSGYIPSPVKVVPTPLGVDVGDISSFDWFFKTDVATKWGEIGGGKKVTPAWGGSKIWKQLVDLKKWADDAVATYGGSEITELQLIRILDDIGGFTGKPKTYEGELLKWLDSTAGKKAVPNPPASLLVKKPDVTPIIKPTALADAQIDDETSFAFLVVGNKAPAEQLFVQLPKYKGGDVIGYVKTADGSILRATASADSKSVLIELRKQIGNDVKWVFDDSFDDAASIINEYNITAADQWSLVLPPKPLLPSKIVGKAPGDLVSADELFASRYLWSDSEILGTATNSQTGVEYRLVAQGGNGLLRIDYKKPDSVEWMSFKSYGTADPVPQFMKEWKLTGDVISSQMKSTLIQDFSPGDKIAFTQIKSMASPPSDKTMTYAYAQDNMYSYRIVHREDGDWEIRYRSNPNALWTYHSTLDNNTGPDPLGLSWRLANNDGSMPNAVATMVPNKLVPGAVTPSKFDGIAVNQSVPLYEVANQEWKFNDLEVIASGKHATGSTQYRLYKLDGKIVLEYKSADSSSWFLWDVFDESKSLILQMEKSGVQPDQIAWFASSQKMHTTSVEVKTAKKHIKTKFPTNPPAAKKAAKKTAKKATVTAPPPPTKKTYTGSQTMFDSKSAGDLVSKKDILAFKGSQELVDGQVIATAKTTGYYGNEWRIVFTSGHLVQQKKSKAGTWIGSKIIEDTWDFDAGYSAEWKAGSGFVSTPNEKALKKFIEKKKGTSTASPSPSKATATPAKATSAKSEPFTIRDVDIRAWNDAEREEIYKYFKSHSGTYVSSSPETIWSAVQAVKSHFQTKYKGKYVQLNELEVLRIVDERGAIKFSVEDTHPFESKVVNWLKTPGGRSYINKNIDAPIATGDVPYPMIRLEDSPIPPDKQTYKYITEAASLKNRQDSHEKYGGWKTGEKAALRKYTSGSYSTWNAAIRSGELGSHRTEIVAAQNGMRPSVVPMVLHRRVGFEELNDPSIVSYETLLPYVGRTYINRGFNSTSFGTKGTWSGPLHIEIEAPIGTPMSHAKDYSHYSGENEVTLAAHLMYEILSVSKESNGTTLMRVRVIGAAKP